MVTSETIQAYITTSSSPTSVRLGTYPCEILSVTPMEEMPSDTLILIDTSGSIPMDIRQKTEELILELIDQKHENEEYSIASFGTKINILCDYTSDRYELVKSLEDLDYSEKYTYLYSVLDELLNHEINHFSKIIMISDGIENSRDGITYDEILNKISDVHYPIYTVGIENKNQESLKKLYSFSRNSFAESTSLTNDSDISLICNMLNSSRRFICVEAAVPDDAADGSVRYLRISGEDYECGTDVRVPVGSIVTETTAYESVASYVGETEAEQSDLSGSNDDKTKNYSMIWLSAAAVAAVIIASVAAFVKKTWRKAENNDLPDEDGVLNIVTRQDIIKDNDVMIMLTDIDFPQCSYRCAVGNGVTIGRDSSQCAVAIERDNYISRKHCLIYRKGGQFFIENYSSNNVVINDKTVVRKAVANDESPDSTRILFDQPVNDALIMDNDIIRIGHTRLKFNVIEDMQNGNKL